MHGTEWVLWEALLSWRSTGEAWWGTGEFRDDLRSYMPDLDRFQRDAGGWVWWMDGPQFLPEVEWLRLVEARKAVPWCSENEEILARANAEAGSRG